MEAFGVAKRLLLITYEYETCSRSQKEAAVMESILESMRIPKGTMNGPREPASCRLMSEAAWLSDDAHRILTQRWMADIVLDSRKKTPRRAIVRKFSFGNLPVTITILRLPSPQD